MTGYYDIIKRLTASLEADKNVNTVTDGSIFDVDINKVTIFPLSHVMINNVTKEGSVLRFNVSVLHMDIENKVVNEGITTTDQADILNTQLAVAVRTSEVFERGDEYTQTYQLDGNPVYEHWTDRFENNIVGWTSTFDILYQHEMTIC